MPYPNEHSCRIRQPGEFEPKSFRRVTSGRVSLIIGKLKGQTATTTQAIRYPKDAWTEAAARKDCASHDGRFEPASDKAQEMEDIRDFDYRNPDDNELIKP
ncbi:MAG: hypothetical protein WC583_02830 [Candidatus Omnitrophota bacterium]|jgi:hypothetical protein|nr:hypothetical protein [Sphaerochaeta sp.]